MKLPSDILFYNILPRLPGKSLPRFMCVSKQWHSFLKTPLFDKLHLHHATNGYHQNNLKFLIFSLNTERTFTAIDCEALDQDGLTLSRSFDFEANTFNMKILASFGGLVCVGLNRFSNGYGLYSSLILWNPLTGDYKTLSNINSHEDCYKEYNQRACGLYYSSCDDDFRLLCVTHDLNAYIYSLKSDAWRRVDDSTEDHLKHIATYLYPNLRLWPSISLNEKLYFLKYYRKDSTRGSIIRFDTKTEKFTEISTPCFPLFPFVPSLGNQHDVFFSLTVLRGRIHFFVIYSRNCDLLQHIECWWMDEDGNWIKEVTLPKASYIIEPLHLMRNGDWLKNSSYDGRAWKLDLTRLVMKEISWSFIPDRRMYIPHRGKYVETLVSPNR